jgi:hypothetical protein
MFSKPPSFFYIEWEKVNGSVLGLVSKILRIQHLTIQPEEVNHDGEIVDRQSDSAQSENRHLWWENRAYMRDEHHDENVGQNQSI